MAGQAGRWLPGTHQRSYRLGLVDLGSYSQKTSVIKALNKVRDGFSGWSVVARHAKGSLDKLISLVETDYQKTSVINALIEADTIRLTGTVWTDVVCKDPESFDKLIGFLDLASYKKKHM